MALSKEDERRSKSEAVAEARVVLNTLAQLEKRASLVDQITKVETDQAAFCREVGIAASLLGLGGKAEVMTLFDVIGVLLCLTMNAEDVGPCKE
jgi:hypothetical protein